MCIRDRDCDEHRVAYELIAAYRDADADAIRDAVERKHAAALEFLEPAFARAAKKLPLAKHNLRDISEAMGGDGGAAARAEVADILKSGSGMRRPPKASRAGENEQEPGGATGPGDGKNRRNRAHRATVQNARRALFGGGGGDFSTLDNPKIFRQRI